MLEQILTLLPSLFFSRQSDESGDSSEDERDDNEEGSSPPCGKKMTLQY